MASATGNEKKRNHFSLLSPEATAASKQLMKWLSAKDLSICGLIFLNRWLSITLPVSYEFLSFLLHITILWTVFWSHVTVFCTKWLWRHFWVTVFFFFSQIPTIFSGKRCNNLLLWTASNLLLQCTTQNCKCSLFQSKMYSDVHIQNSPNSGRAQTAVTAIIFWLCINSLSGILGLVTTFFLVWKMTWLIENKHWSSSILSSSLSHMHMHTITCIHVCIHV